MCTKVVSTRLAADGKMAVTITVNVWMALADISVQKCELNKDLHLPSSFSLFVGQ